MSWLRRTWCIFRSWKLHLRSTFILLILVCLIAYMCILSSLLKSTTIFSADDRYVFASDNNNPFEKGFSLTSERQMKLRHENLDLDSETRMRHLMANRQRLDSDAELYNEDLAETSLISDNKDNIFGINCRNIHEVGQRDFLAAGWTKAVYGGRFRGKPVAVKTVNIHGHDFESCLAQSGSSSKECYRKSAAKILKEIVLLKELVHTNILKIYGYCIPSGDYSPEASKMIAMVTELGNPVDIIKLLQMSWEDRLRISLGVARLLYHLAHSPLGSLAMNDFRRQQFVMVNGEVKLSDVDDIGLDEPICTEQTPCLLHIPASNSTVQIDCVQDFCKGYNEKQNIAKAGRHFTTFLLPHGAPSSLKPLIDELVTAYQNLSWNSDQLLKLTEKIVHLFKSGRYLERNGQKKIQAYKKYGSSDLPGEYDYRCRLSLSGNGCTLSVFDVQEAQEICASDTDCKAFVMTNESTWTGRKIVHFKNNYSYPVWNARTNLYIKVP